MFEPPPKPYTLKFINESRNAWTFCVYLSPPQVNAPDVQAMAWLTADAAPTTHVSLSWTLDYGFTWLRTASISHGKVIVTSSQVWPADLEQKNQITYTAKHGLPTFASPGEGANSGSLYIGQDRRVDANKSLVGFAIAGSPVYTVPAQPNVDLIFTPDPHYWVTFGRFVQGQVLDLSEITNSAPVVFSPNTHNMVARLNADNLWSIEEPEVQ